MKKKISFSAQGQQADIEPMVIHRVLPNRYADKVWSFVFLDHVAPILHSEPIIGCKGKSTFTLYRAGFCPVSA